VIVNMKRCSRCILPARFPGLSLNSDGVCGFCITGRSGERAAKAKIDNVEEFIDGHRNPDGPYDCAIALSGGRDSSFAAYVATRDLGLRTLLVTVDNGFLPDGTKRNIAEATQALGADAVTVPNERVKRNAATAVRCWARRPSAAAVAFFCAGCITGIKQDVVETARQNGVSLVINGAGEPEISVAEHLLRVSWVRRRAPALALGAAREMLKNPWFILNPGAVTQFAREGYVRFGRKYRRRSRQGIRLVSVYDLTGWNEQRILSTVEGHLNWRTPSHSTASWRSDCKMHIVKQYLYRELLGFTKNDIMLSALVRRGEITREEALERLERDNVLPRDFLVDFLNELGVDFADLERAVGAA
jgi:hypothetical protein